MAEFGVQTSARAARPDSDDALRNLKASEAADAAFATAGYAGAPQALKDIVTARVKSLTENIPANQLSGTSTLATEAAAGVQITLTNLTEAQRAAIKNGSDIESKTLQRLDGLLNGFPLGLRHVGGVQAERGDASGGTSGLRFGELPGSAGDWMRLPQVREAQGLAVQFGMAWACNNRELMILGPSAIQALHDVDLKKQSYDTLTKTFRLTAKETVETAKHAKEKGVDLNAATKAADDFYQALPASERDAFRNQTRQYFPHMGEPKADRDYADQVREAVRAHPELAPKAEPLLHALHAEQQKLNTANQQTAGKIATTEIKDAKADAAAAQTQGKQIKTANTLDDANSLLADTPKSPPDRPPVQSPPKAKSTGPAPSH